MKSQMNRSSESKVQLSSNKLSTGPDIKSFNVMPMDNRPAVVTQRKLQETANTSPRVVQAAQLQAMMQKKMGPPKESVINYSPPIHYHHAEVMQLMPWYARMALGAVPGAILGGLGALGVIPALALGVAGAGIGAYLGNDAAEEEQIPAHGSAEERLERMSKRGSARRDRERIATGRYDTPTGPTTVSGIHRQRMTQSRREDYGGETFGSLPAYDDIQGNLPDEALPLLSDRHASKPQMTDREKLATSLSHTLVHGSEEDRAPGTSSYFRAMNRDFIRTAGDGLHPLSTENFPARSTAQEQRDLMEGRTALSEQQRRALENDSGASSGEDEPHYIDR